MSGPSPEVTCKSAVFIALGSNIPPRRTYLKAGLQELSGGGTEIVSLSSLYETEPVEMRASMPFLNQVCQVRTGLDAQQLLELCIRIEQRLGRKRRGNYLARTLDLDLLFYGQQQIQTKALWLPHPRLSQRLFVLIPLAEVAPDFKDPVTGLSIRILLKQCRDSHWVRRLPGEG